MSDFWRAWRSIGLLFSAGIVVDISHHWNPLYLTSSVSIWLAYSAGMWAPYKLLDPWARRQFSRGTGAWGRVTRRDKRKRAEMFAEMERRIASGEYTPIRMRKTEGGRWVRVTEDEA